MNSGPELPSMCDQLKCRNGAARMSGSARVGVHNPDGVAIASGVSVSLQISRAGAGWQTIGTGADANGVASVAFKIPAGYAGKPSKVRAVATGTGYRPAASGARAFTVKRR